MLSYGSCYHGSSVTTSTSPSSASNSYYPRLQTLGHLPQFSNMTYGEVLNLYQTPSSAMRRSVPLSENPKPVLHHFKQVKQSASSKMCLLEPKDVNKFSESNEGVYQILIIILEKSQFHLSILMDITPQNNWDSGNLSYSQFPFQGPQL